MQVLTGFDAAEIDELFAVPEDDMSRLLIEKPGMLFKSELAKGNKDCRKEFVIGAMLAFYQAELFAKIVGRCL